MKRLLLPAFLFLSIHAAIGGPAEDLAAVAQARKETIVLLRQGKLPESKQRLSAVLSAGGTAASNDFVLGRQWITIAFHFYSRGELPLARQAAVEALAIATAASRTVGISSERASLLSNTGLICERILRE